MKPHSYFAKVTITGTRVQLEPLSARHLADLTAAGTSEDIWRFLPMQHNSPGSMEEFINNALMLFERSMAVPFATIDLASSTAVGSTRFHYVEEMQKRLEIGVTWISPRFQRSYINTEAKFLQLWYAFEVLGCRRVEFKADADNMKSREAILRLGAKEEGYFRKHMIYADGRNRDSVYFSIIDEEWPNCRQGLLTRVGYAINPKISERVSA